MDIKSDKRHPIAIYKDATLADFVLKRLYARQHTLLALESDEQSHQNNTRVSIITTTMAVHRWLSVYGPNAFKNVAGSTPTEQPALQIAISRVAPVTGDVLLQFSGNKDHITDALLLFLQKTYSNTYSAVALVDRHTALSAPDELSSTRFKCSKFPYGLLPGYLMNISSNAVEEVLYFCCSLAKQNSSTLDTSTKFNSPNKFSTQEIRHGISQRPLTERKNRGRLSKQKSIRKKGSSSKSTTGTSSPPQEPTTEMTWKLLEFTRQEVTYLIGRNGSKIEALRQNTGATIRVIPITNVLPTPTEQEFKSQPRNNKLTQFIRVTGPKPQVQHALATIEAEIYQFRMGETARY